MKQQEYLQKIKELFLSILKSNSAAFDRHCYNNNEYSNYIKKFLEALSKEGISVSSCYHLHGIGNNHEYQLYKRDIDSEGFVIEKKIAKFSYTTGIFGGVSVYLKDYNTDTIIDSFGHAR